MNYVTKTEVLSINTKTQSKGRTKSWYLAELKSAYSSLLIAVKLGTRYEVINSVVLKRLNCDETFS